MSKSIQQEWNDLNAEEKKKWTEGAKTTIWSPYGWFAIAKDQERRKQKRELDQSTRF